MRAIARNGKTRVILDKRENDRINQALAILETLERFEGPGPQADKLDKARAAVQSAMQSYAGEEVAV